MVDLSRHPLLGRWRIVERALWDANFLDLVQPAYISVDDKGGGEAKTLTG